MNEQLKILVVPSHLLLAVSMYAIKSACNTPAWDMSSLRLAGMIWRVRLTELVCKPISFCYSVQCMVISIASIGGLYHLSYSCFSLLVHLDYSLAVALLIPLFRYKICRLERRLHMRLDASAALFCDLL